MGSELLERARDLRSEIDAAGGAAAESGATAPPQELVSNCFEAGLYGALSPRAVGGAELPIDDCLDVVAEVAYGDGSVGWSLMAGATGACFFGAYCPDRFIREMFAGGAVPVVAGQFAPNGTAVPNGDGFQWKLTITWLFRASVCAMSPKLRIQALPRSERAKGQGRHSDGRGRRLATGADPRQPSPLQPPSQAGNRYDCREGE